MVSAKKSIETVVAANDLPEGWRLKGQLFAHLHEHKSAITKLVGLSGNSWSSTHNGNSSVTSFFASCSTDGTVRLWDCNRMDGNQSINRSCQKYTANVPLYAMTAFNSGRSLAVSGNDGSLMMLRIDSNSSLMALQDSRQMDMSKNAGQLEDGPVVDIQHLQHGSNSLIVYATIYGSIICWDLRMPGDAWKVKIPLRSGVITTLCADPTSSWMVSGTSGGKQSVWDLRFTMPLSKFRVFEIINNPIVNF